jgi:hypothetical protein
MLCGVRTASDYGSLQLQDGSLLLVWQDRDGGILRYENRGQWLVMYHDELQHFSQQLASSSSELEGVNFAMSNCRLFPK